MTGFDRWMEILCLAYDNGSEPLYAWKAIAECHAHKQPFPKWVDRYLKMVALRLVSIPETDEHKMPALISGALGMTGLGSRFKESHNESRELGICYDIEEIKNNLKEVKKSEKHPEYFKSIRYQEVLAAE